jgi:hypothetical protein
LTKEEASKEHDTSKFVYAVKLLREIAGEEQKKYEYSVIRKIGKAMQRQLRDVSNKFDKSIKTHMSMWENAKYICTLLGDETRSCYELDSNIVGCLHTSASIGSGLSTTHRDPGNAGWEWGALPDFHVNLTQNENIGFVVYIRTGDKRVRPIIVVQERMASTYFYGSNQMHGTIHIGTYLKVFNEHYEVNGLQLAVNVHDYWSIPVVDISTRVFVSYYTKHNLAMTSEVKKAYDDIGQQPEIYNRINGHGKGQDKRSRDIIQDRRLDQWVPSCPGKIHKVTKMKDIQSGCNWGPTVCAGNIGSGH